MKRLAILLVFILLFSSLIPLGSSEFPPAPPLTMVSGPYLKYDTTLTFSDNYYTCMERIPSSQYILVVYGDSTSGMTLATLRVWNTNGTVQNKVTSSYTVGGSPQWTSMCHVSGTGGASGDIYAVYSSEDNWIKTFRVWGTNGTVQNAVLDTESGYSGSSYYHQNITKVNPNWNVYVVMEGGRYLYSYTIDNTTGAISATVDNEDVSGASTGGWSLIMADSDTIITCYRDNMKTYNISATGLITGTGLGACFYNMGGSNIVGSLVRQNSSGSDVYLEVYWSSDDYCRARTFRVWGNGTIQKSVLDTETLDGANQGHSTQGYPLGADQFVATYHERDTGNWINKFFNVSNAGVITAAFKTYDSGRGDQVSLDVAIPVSYMENDLFVECAYDNDEELNFYTFWRNASHPALPSWKTAADWNGTLVGIRAWITDYNWNGTFWNNSRIWRVTTLNERFTLAPNNAPSITDTAWRGQSFTIGKTGANTNFYLHSIALNLRKDTTSDPPLLYTVMVYAADSDHKPTGPILGTATIDTGRLTTSFSWINCSGCAGPSPLLTAGTKYVMVLFKSTASAYNIRWGPRNNATTPGSASYTGGYSITSSNSGLTWSLVTGIDFDFMVWGSTLSDFPPIWNGTLWNTSVAWKPAANWNGTLWNDTLFQRILWNGSLWNSTHWIPNLGIWNGSFWNWTIRVLTITINGFGTVTTNFSAPYHIGDIVTLTASPAAFTTFLPWTGTNNNAINPTTVTMNTDKTVTANFLFGAGTFTYTDNDTDLPKITDIINPDTNTFDWARVFTYAWVWALGGWFFALILGVIGGAIYIQSKRLEVTAAYFIIVLILYASITQNIGYVVGIVIALIIGFLFYRLLKSK
jgi:hypothetical protein